MTQATEVGSIYSLAEIDEISAIAKEHDLPLHMDGARFANALVHLGATPADMTWKRGVDVLSFGGTKNGCWCAEAIVFFDPAMAKELPFIRKRSAQLFSKSRFIAAQFDAYLQDDLWLGLASHANSMADRLRAGLDASNSARQAWPTTSNEVFAVVPKTTAEAAQEKGAKFYDWLEPHDMPEPVKDGEMLIRLVTSFATEAQDVDAFLEVLAAA
jgi:threonine aldolase